MAFVNDDDLIRHRKLAEHHMLHLQSAHQYLVDRADEEIGERALLTSPEPVGDNGFRRYINLFS